MCCISLGIVNGEMIIHAMIASGKRWRDSREIRRMLIRCERHTDNDVVSKLLGPSSGRNECMSKI